jgi:hypothetical protein
VLGKSQGFERRVELDLPGCVFRCMGALTRVVLGQPLLQVGRVAV